MVIWIIGLSASGKTTLGRTLHELWKKESPNTVFVDGDDVRKMFEQTDEIKSYTMEERRKNADRICRMCAWLDSQNINVVCSIQSIFKESREWNRGNYSKYFEVYIDVPMEVLLRRETKGLYASAKRGERKNVVGIDIPFTPPENPDYTFDNSKDVVDMGKIAREILTLVLKRT